MDNKFLEAMTEQSMLMMKKACAGESLNKEEINFILLTQKLSEKEEKKQTIPQIINSSKKFLPLISSLVFKQDIKTNQENQENINE